MANSLVVLKPVRQMCCGSGKTRKVKQCLKLAEELSELSTVILQQINKPEIDLEKKITWGIGDVYYRLDQVTEYYDREEIMIQAWSRRKRTKETVP